MFIIYGDRTTRLIRSLIGSNLFNPLTVIDACMHVAKAVAVNYAFGDCFYRINDNKTYQYLYILYFLAAAAINKILFMSATYSPFHFFQ